MTKNVQCRSGYVNHWEAQPPYIANYKFSSIEFKGNDSKNYGNNHETTEKSIKN